MPSEEKELLQVPREFSVYTGFGAPLKELDDMDLLASMAQLKQTALGERPSRYAPQPPAPHRAAPIAQSSHPTRPGLKGTQHPTVPPVPPPPAERPHARPAPPPPIGHNTAFRAGLTAREQIQKLRNLRAQDEERVAHNLARLEFKLHRKKGGQSPRSYSYASYAQAGQSVQRWKEKRQQGQERLLKAESERIGDLILQQHLKDEKAEAWRAEQEAQEKKRREELERVRASATRRFAAGVENREKQLADAEVRVALRQSTLAELKRLELRRRAEEAEQRAAKNLQARLTAERALQDHVASTAETLRRKAKQVEAHEARQREQWERRRQASAGKGDVQAQHHVHAPSHVVSPRRHSEARVTSEGSSTPRARGKQHEGRSGLEKLPVRCALCEQEFSSLSGMTFLKAVASQRAEFGDFELLKWCERRGLLKMYESASLCVFCCQFFQSRWLEKDVL
jgi:hypothetical protein